MAHTLPIIDGRGQLEALLTELRAAGYVCQYARGPLRARALFAETPIALAVWRDAGNPDLANDRERVWSEHLEVPLLRLYPAGTR